MSLYLFIALLTFFSACGLLSSDEHGGLLQVTPISAVEVALDIQAPKGADITIERDGQPRFSFRLNRTDTLLYETGLQPVTSYQWKATSSFGRGVTAERQATTLDTTSSNFTWQTFSFGEHSSSVLYGVSIIDENNIWAVGEIHMNDSTGQADSDIYNAVHWDGEGWTLKRIPYFYQGKSFYNPIQTIYSFNENSILFAGNGLIYWNNSEYLPIEISQIMWGPNQINKIWGLSANSFYIAGNNGSIAYYNGQDWQKIETNTELDFYDIHGNPEQRVVAVAAKQSQNSDKEILRIKSNLETKSLPTKPIPFSISGTWFDQSGVTYMVGSRISLKSNINSTVPWKILDKEHIGHPYLFAIDANGLNDMVTAGGYGELFHYNGLEWIKHNQEIIGNLYDIAIKENVAMAVGLDGRKAFITIGKRESYPMKEGKSNDR